jgi:hypothetical protein
MRRSDHAADDGVQNKLKRIRRAERRIIRGKEAALVYATDFKERMAAAKVA